jgi:hypothetical protein
MQFVFSAPTLGRTQLYDVTTWNHNEILYSVVWASEKCKGNHTSLTSWNKEKSARSLSVVCAKTACRNKEYYSVYINPLKTKRRLLYLKAQSVPRCKHFSSRL